MARAITATIRVEFTGKNARVVSANRLMSPKSDVSIVGRRLTKSELSKIIYQLQVRQMQTGKLS